jgi:hypothetical protein
MLADVAIWSSAAEIISRKLLAEPRVDDFDTDLRRQWRKCSPSKITRGRYRPDDRLQAFLEALQIMPICRADRHSHNSRSRSGAA